MTLVFALCKIPPRAFPIFMYYITMHRKGERKYGHTENFSVSIPELGEIRWKSGLSDGTFAWYNTLVKKELVPAVERFLEKE
jgi:activator of HSP90 ATPase